MPAILERTIHLPSRHDAQERIALEASRFNVLNCGRRFGKDVLGIDLLIDTALDGWPVAWFSPTYKNLTEVWRVLVNVLEPITKRRSEQEHRLELHGRGIIDMWSLDQPDTARGRAYKRVVINEAAMVSRLQEAWEQVIRPTLTDYIGDAFFLSTPKGFNYFKTLYDRGQDSEQPDWRSWQFPTAANPFINAGEVEAARQELPEKIFAQEYLAQFVNDENTVFKNIVGVAQAKRQEQRQEGHSYVIGVDLARVNDFSVCMVIDTSCRPPAVVAMERFNQTAWRVQIERIKSMAKRFLPSMIVVDQTGVGDPIVQQLQRELGGSIWPGQSF